MALCLNAVLGPSIRHECTCVGFYFDQVYVGTTSGRVVQYELKNDGQDNVEEVCIQQISDRHPVQQIEVIGELGKVLVLVEARLIALDARTLEPSTNDLASSVEFFRINQAGPPFFEICIAGLTKLDILRFSPNDASFSHYRTIPVPTVPRDLQMSGASVCVSFDRDFVLFDTRSGASKQVYEKHEVKKDGNAMYAEVKAISDNRFLLCIDSLGVIISANGEPAGNALIWTSTPRLVAYSSPFIITVLSQSRIEVHSTMDEDQQQSLVQALKVEGVTAIADAPLWTSIPRVRQRQTDGEKGIKDTSVDSIQLSSSGPVLVLTNFPTTAVSRIASVSIDERIKQLLEQLRVEEAFSLLNDSLPSEREDRAERVRKLREFHVDAGISLLKAREVEGAFGHFAMAELDSREIIAHFPSILPQDFTFTPALLRPIRVFNDIDVDNGEDKEPLLRCNFLCLFKEESAENLQKLAVRLHLAAMEYLERRRAILVSAKGADDFVIDQRLEEAIDSALLNDYLLFCDADAGDADLAFDVKAKIEFFLSQPNQVVATPLLLKRLQEKSLHHASALLLVSKKQFRGALEVWADMGAGKLKESGRDGVNETVDFLSKHTNAQEIWIFSSWVVRNHPFRGIKIFTERSSLSELNPNRVLEHLSSFAEHRKAQLRMMYLEHLVANGTEAKREQSDDSEALTTFDTLLGIEYVKTLEAFVDDNEEIAKYVDCAPEAAPAHIGLRNLESIRRIRKTFQKFIAVNDLFELEAVIRSIDDSTLGHVLLDEKVELFAKMHMHTEALRILVFEKKDNQLAEEYCLRQFEISCSQAGPPVQNQISSRSYYKSLRPAPSQNNETIQSSLELSMTHGGPPASSNEDQSNPFLELLRIYLVKDGTTDEATQKAFQQASMQLLKRHAELIDPVSVLKILPESVILDELLEYLRLTFSDQAHKKRQGNITKHLASAENVRVKHQLSQLRGNKIVVDEDSLCRICGAGIGLASFQRVPRKKKESSVAHLACIS